MIETFSRGEAIARFFEAADKAGITSLKDPAGRCGEIDKKMNFGKLRSKLKVAAGLARQAMDAEYARKNRFQLMQDATHPSVFWRKLFGKEYPEARERYWRAPASEPWFGKYRAETPPRPGPGDMGSDGFGGGPKPPPGDGPKPPPGGGPSGPGGPREPGPFGGFFDRADGVRRARTTRRRPTVASTGRHAGPASAEPVTNLWTGVFGAAAATVSVPLTFG
jgi:hypothetical protein